jgi:RNA polymerase sigma-70 factor (ECF subfamily)
MFTSEVAMARSRDRESPNLRLVAPERTPARLPMSAKARAEVAVAAAVLDGDRSTLDALVRANAAKIFAIARRYARAPQDARDLAEKAFGRALGAARRALRRDPQRAVPLERWLVRATLKAARDHLRHEVRLSSAVLDEIGPRDVPRPVIGGAPRATEVRSRVLQLPGRLREVLTLRIDPELPFSDIAAVLGITETAAVVDFHDAARRLRRVAGVGVRSPACARYEVLLSSRVVGSLERSDTGRIDAHVAGCQACSAVAEATAAALGLAALGPASDRERAMTEELAARVIAAVERAERRRAAARDLIVAAAVAVLVLVGARLASPDASHGSRGMVASGAASLHPGPCQPCAP